MSQGVENKFCQVLFRLLLQLPGILAFEKLIFHVDWYSGALHRLPGVQKLEMHST